MSAYLFAGVSNKEHIIFTSSTDTIPPIKRQEPTKEAMRSNNDGPEESSKSGPSILEYTRLFVDKFTIISWLNIKYVFNKKELLEDLEDMEVYIKVKSSRFHKISYRYLILPCEK